MRRIMKKLGERILMWLPVINGLSRIKYVEYLSPVINGHILSIFSITDQLYHGWF